MKGSEGNGEYAPRASSGIPAKPAKRGFSLGPIGLRSSRAPTRAEIAAVPMRARAQPLRGPMRRRAEAEIASEIGTASPHISGRSGLSGLWTSSPTIPLLRRALERGGKRAEVERKPSERRASAANAASVKASHDPGSAIPALPRIR